MKTNTYLSILFLFFAQLLMSQVGIGTTNPNSQLDIRSSNQATPANNDGILVPKVDAFPVTNPTVAQQGMLVFLTTTSGANQPGFYYWDNPTTTWIGLSSTANGDQDWHEEGTTTAPNAITDDMFHMGNVAIGKNTITDSSLEIENTVNLKSLSITNNLTSPSTNYGIFTVMTGTGNGQQYGDWTQINNSGNNAHFGSYNELSGAGAGTHIGRY